MAKEPEQVLQDIHESWEHGKKLYAMYLRKSRADLELEALGEEETLARHKSMLYKLAEKYNITPDQIVIYHEMVSGDSISERPEMQRLLNDVYQKKYTGVFCAEVERLARGNTSDQGQVADAFQYSSTEIITPAKRYDPNNEFDQEYFEFGLFMSRREYKTIKRRMEAGRVESFEEGNYVGSRRPYGFNIERRSKKERVLVEKPEESQYVKMIFDWFTIDRHTAGWIARKLTEMRVPTMDGKPEWNRGTVKDILQNEHYTGKVRWNRRKKRKEYDAESGKVSKTTRRLSKGEYKIFEGKHDGFISQEQFDFAQTLFVGQVPSKALSTICNPFAGLLYCADCGKTLSFQSYNRGESDKRRSRYVHRESQICQKKSSPCDLVVDAFIDGIKGYISDFEIKLSNDGNQDESNRHAAMIEALEAELAKQERKKRKLFSDFEGQEGEELYTKAEFIERKQMYNATIEEIKQQLEIERAAAPAPVNYEEKIMTLHKIIELMKNPEVSAKAKNDFLKMNIARINYDAIDLGRNKGVKPVLDIILR